MNKNQLKKVINTLQTYVDNKIDNLPASYEEKLLLTVPKESIDKSKADAATNENPYTINIPGNGFEYVEGMFNNADIIIEYNGKKYMITEAVYNTDDDIYFIESENNYFAFDINKINSSDTQLLIFKLDTTNITDIKLYMRKKDINIANLKVGNSISIGRVGSRGPYSAAIGYNVEASGTNSHAEGNDTEALGHSSHAEGSNTIASGSFSHAEGIDTKALGDSSHTEGVGTTASGESSHAEGYYTKASSEYQHVQGKYNIEDTAKKYAHIVGNGKRDNNRSNAHTLDWQGNAWFAGEVQGSNIPHIISEETVLTVPAASIDKTKAAAARVDAPYNLDVSSVFTKDDTKEYFITYGGKTFNIDNNDINISVGYNAEGVEDATKTQIVIYKLDTTNVTDINVVAKKIQYLDDLYLDKDLKIKNSISVGNRMGAIGEYSSAIGVNVIASGESSHAEGAYTTASGISSHAEGAYTTASRNYSHAEGYKTIASGNYSHAEGVMTTASGYKSHAEGAYTIASGDSSHAEGDSTKASSDHQHVQGRYNIEDTANKYAHIVGNGKKDKSTNYEEVRSNAHTLDWEGNAWYAGEVQATNLPYTISETALFNITVDQLNKAYTESQSSDDSTMYIEVPNFTIKDDTLFFIEINNKRYRLSGLYTEDITEHNKTRLSMVFFNINDTTNNIQGGDAQTYIDKTNEYSENVALVSINRIDDKKPPIFTSGIKLFEISVNKLNMILLGKDVDIYNSLSIQRKSGSKIGQCSTAMGGLTEASGDCTHAEGYGTIASGYCSHAEGNGSKASSDYSHAEGMGTTSSGDSSHTEGKYTKASGCSSHAEGVFAIASGDTSHAEGYRTKASSQYQHVQGQCNIEDTANKYAHIVGNGTDDTARSNAHTLDWEGNAWYAGKLSQEGTPTEDKDLVTKKYVDDSHPRIVNEYTIELTADELNALHADAYYGTASSYSVMVSSYNFNFTDISHVEVFVKFKDKLLYIKDHCYYNNFYFRKNIVTGADGEYFANIYIEEQNYKFTEGITIYLKEVSTYYSSVFNPNDVVIGNSITIGGRNYADGYGYKIGQFSAAIGSNVRAPYDGSVAIGINTAADNNYAFASGEGTIAGDRGSHAEGYNTVANGEYSHAEGESTHATGKFSHAEGGGTNANSIGSHAEGQDTVACGDYSHVEGKSTNSYGASYLHVQGMYNADRDYKDAKKYAHIVGNGHYDEETKTEVRSDAHTLDWEGNAWYSGKLTVGKDPEEDMDVTTKKYVDEHSISVIDGFTMRDQTNNYKYLMQLRDGVLTSVLLPSSISVDSSSLTNLNDGDIIEGKDLVINATYPDGTTSALSDSDKKNIICTPKELTADVKQITVKYKVGDYELTQTINVTVSAFDPAVKLQDFNYTSNGDGTYTLTGWKETHNGVASTEMIIPNNKKIIL